MPIDDAIDALVTSMEKRVANPPQFHCLNCGFPVYLLNALSGNLSGAAGMRPIGVSERMTPMRRFFGGSWLMLAL